MKTISSIEDLVDLDINLVKFILGSCPWVTKEWSAEDFGFVFVLEDSDREEVTSVCTVPHIDMSDTDYRDLMTINLESYDLWESPAFYDEGAEYWSVVALFGQDYGCVLFLSAGFVESMPALLRNLQDIKSTRRNIM